MFNQRPSSKRRPHEASCQYCLEPRWRTVSCFIIILMMMLMMMMIIIIIIIIVTIIATIRICVAYCDLEFLGLTPETPRQSYIFSIGKR